ncbi:MAG: hypothetical protein IPP37_22110 [Saprospiraceae bacterium]|nr:hypothetical protein [Saprospiraceae bacterium]
MGKKKKEKVYFWVWGLKKKSVKEGDKRESIFRKKKGGVFKKKKEKKKKKNFFYFVRRKKRGEGRKGNTEKGPTAGLSARL